MKIELVKLENIRSHVKSTVPFARGFNCLVGGLGCGKSSILYSIDFALFGDPLGRSYEYLLREGADSGSVMVQFVQNDKSYRIVRGLKRRGKGISQDFDELKLFEGDEVVASVKSEAVSEQIRSITGLDKKLFQEIVWVRQEYLKELLNAQPRERQKRLDELFGLSDYEAAWSSLAMYQRDYEAEKRAYERDPDVAGMERLGEEHNRTVQEFSLVEIQLEQAGRDLVSAKKAVEEADQKLKRLEETRVLNEELRRKETRIVANLSTTGEALSLLAEQIQGKQIDLDNLKRRLSGAEAQMAHYKAELEEAGFQQADSSAEGIKKRLAELENKISSLKGEQEAHSRSMHADAKRIASLSSESENRCPLCLQVLTEEYRTGLVKRVGEENAKREELIGQLEVEIAKLQQARNKASAAFSNMQALAPRIEDIRARVAEVSAELNDLLAEFGKKQELERGLRLQLESVRLEIGRFDLSALEASRALARQAFQRCSMLEAELRTLESRKRELARRLDELKERIDQAQVKIDRVNKLAKAAEVIGGLREAFRSIQPKLRSEFVKMLRSFVQQVLDTLVGEGGQLLNVVVDEDYTPYVKSESGVERDVSFLSGGERTLLAFAYRLGLGQLIMQYRTGHGLGVLLLDEPTESLGREDGSVDRLAEAISRFKAIEQIIAVTHSEAFAEKAEHVIRLEKEAGESKITLER
ncbi:MAG: SMC family ATPase [Candidatus Bathyarchaeota archaeon]|nr:SMC family ATPase [Candidatus Bathyarchaeota archaeon]